MNRYSSLSQTFQVSSKLKMKEGKRPEKGDGRIVEQPREHEHEQEQECPDAEGGDPGDASGQGF